MSVTHDLSSPSRFRRSRAFLRLFIRLFARALAILLGLCVAQCGPSLSTPKSASAPATSDPAHGDSGAPSVGVQDTGSSQIVSTGEAALNLAGNYQPVILDSDGLTTVYRRVFGDQPRAQSANPYFQAHPTEFFTPQEKIALGTFQVTSDRPGFRMTALSVVTQDYVLTLRNFLADACDALVKRERGSPNAPSNKLVQGDVPSTARMNAFMDQLFGTVPPPSTGAGAAPVNAGVDDYRALMAGALAGVKDPATRDKLVSEVNFLFCFHAGEDPRVYLK